MRKFLSAQLAGYEWVRLLPMVGAIGYLALLHTPEISPSGWDWAFAMVSGYLVLLGGQFPSIIAVTQCVLLGAAVLLAQVGAGVVQILACIALAELALRRPGRQTWCGALLVAAASCANRFAGYSLAANALVVALDVGIPLLLGSFVRSQRQLAVQAEQRAAEAERSKALAATAARAAERAAIARELHDVVAHHVASIVLRVGVVRHVVPTVDPRLDEVLLDVHTTGGRALADLRGLVSVLRDPDTVGESGMLSSADLGSSLDDLVTRTRAAGVAVYTEIDSRLVERLSTAQRHAVLRLMQEGLTNVLKHAGPDAEVRLALRHKESAVHIDIVDNGGRHRMDHGVEPGHGLIVMRERVELLHGTLRVGPEGAGWALHARLPHATGVPS